MPPTVAIIGLGTAGAAVAALAARRGFRVVALERGPLGSAGARWVNGVPEWTYRYAGLALPEYPERRGGHCDVHLVAGWGSERVRLRSVLEIDMRHLISRLQAMAADAGAQLHGDTHVSSFDGRRIETSRGAIEADVFVDASGMNGARLLAQPAVDREDICVAAQEVRALADPHAARAFFAAHGAREGESLIFTGVAGGYSIVNVHLGEDFVALLTGSIPALGHRSGTALLRDFAKAQGWVGETLFGGARAIPLRRPYMEIGRDNVAAVGDAACQVYPAHGSGIGQQLVAAKVLVDALDEGAGPDGYNHRFQRGWSGTLAGSDLFRRFSSDLGTADLEKLLRHGVLSPGLMQDGMVQRSPRPPVRTVLRSGAGLARLPGISRRLAPVLVRMQLVERHYKRYPAERSGLPRWRKRLERLSGIREP